MQSIFSHTLDVQGCGFYFILTSLAQKQDQKRRYPFKWTWIIFTATSIICKGLWLMFLLLRSGDVEVNPGPKHLSKAQKKLLAWKIYNKMKKENNISSTKSNATSSKLHISSLPVHHQNMDPIESAALPFISTSIDRDTVLQGQPSSSLTAEITKTRQHNTSALLASALKKSPPSSPSSRREDNSEDNYAYNSDPENHKAAKRAAYHSDPENHKAVSELLITKILRKRKLLREKKKIAVREEIGNSGTYLYL